MSEHNSIPRRVEPPLPAELARCESLLAGMVLPATKLDRDAVLYRAGWAAAEAELSGLAKTEASGSQRDDDRRRLVAWSLGSAVVAATLACWITRGLTPPVETVVPRFAEVEREAEPPVEVAETGATEEARPPVSSRLRREPVRWSASLLALRDRALRQEWEELGRGVGGSDTRAAARRGETVRGAATSRDLLREFLQTSDGNDRPAKPLLWPWGDLELGEST